MNPTIFAYHVAISLRKLKMTDQTAEISLFFETRINKNNK